MSLKDAMRRAAELLVDLPDDPQATPANSAANAATTRGEPDIDELLSVLDGAKTGKSAGAPVSRVPGSAAASAPKTVAQVVRDAPGPNLDEIKAGAVSPLKASGEVDFAAIYAGAKLPQAPLPAEQVLEMLHSLPAQLPLEVKRQTVKATLIAVGKNLGASPETIVADASRKLAALHASVEAAHQNAQQTVTREETEIANLQAQIEKKRGAIQDSRQKLQTLTQGCDAESKRLDEVLEFFSLDVPPSQYAPGQAAPAQAPNPVPPQNK